MSYLKKECLTCVFFVSCPVDPPYYCKEED